MAQAEASNLPPTHLVDVFDQSEALGGEGDRVLHFDIFELERRKNKTLRDELCKKFG